MQIDELLHKFINVIDTARVRRNKLIYALINDELIMQLQSKVNMGCINLNLLLSEKLMDIPVSKRSRAVGTIINEVIKANDAEILAFTDYELLFLPELKQDPLRLFEELSRERIIVVFWRGKYENGTLTHAEPWHREYREYSIIDAEVIQA